MVLLAVQHIFFIFHVAGMIPKYLIPFFVGCLSAPGQLKDQEHFVSVDFTWSSAADVLAALRGNPGLAEGIGARAREWAESHLTEALEGLTKGRGYQMVMWEIKELSRPTSI